MAAASIYDILTVQWLKDTVLLGVDLTLDDGSAYPDTQYQQAIRQAVHNLEHDLGIRIDPLDIEGEQHDLYAPDRSAFWPFRLDERPMRAVSALRLHFGGFPPMDFPASWIRLIDQLYGQVHVIPSSESLSSYIIRAGIPLIAGDVAQTLAYIPGYFQFDYTAGFLVETGTVTLPEGQTEVAVTFDESMPEPPRVDLALTVASGAAGLRVKRRSLSGFTAQVTTPPAGGAATITWTADSIPDDLKQAIAIVASGMPLSVAGDLIAGAGIASISTSMDGLSQSINTTSSATNSGYGARILELRKQLDALLPSLRARYRVPNIAIL